MTKAHGLRGHVVVRSETDHPGRFARGACVETDDGSRLTVESASEADRGLLVRFEHVHDRSAAEELVGTRLWIMESERRDLADGEFWPDQLTGLTAFDVDGAAIGTVSAVLQGPAQDRLEVTTAEGVRVEVPFVAELVTEVDVSGGRVVIATIEGLIEPR